MKTNNIGKEINKAISTCESFIFDFDQGLKILWKHEKLNISCTETMILCFQLCGVSKKTV